jgi:hypothetical protein
VNGDVFHWALLLLPAVTAVAFAWMTAMSWRAYSHALQRAREERTGTRSKNNAEHGLVLSLTFLLVSLGNVLTGFGLVTHPPDGGVSGLTEGGAILVRGVLVAAAIYLAIRHPRPPEDEQ